MHSAGINPYKVTQGALSEDNPIICWNDQKNKNNFQMREFRTYTVKEKNLPIYVVFTTDRGLNLERMILLIENTQANLFSFPPNSH
jgi:hypothetical protein